MDQRDLIAKLKNPLEWHALDRTIRADIAKSLTVSIKLSLITSHWMQFDIEWLDPEWGIDSAYVYRRFVPSCTWSDEEKALLRANYLKCTRDELLQMFPDRTWDGIVHIAKGMEMNRPGKERASIPIQWTVQDWKFMQQEGLDVSEEDRFLLNVAYWRRQAIL